MFVCMQPRVYTCLCTCVCVWSYLQGYRMSNEGGPLGVNVTCVKVNQSLW